MENHLVAVATGQVERIRDGIAVGRNGSIPKEFLSTTLARRNVVVIPTHTHTHTELVCWTDTVWVLERKMDLGAGISIRRIEITVLASRSLIGARVTRPQFRNENPKNEKPNQESLPSMYSSGRSASSPGLDERQIRLLDTHTHTYPEEANLLEWANKNKPTMQIGRERENGRS